MKNKQLNALMIVMTLILMSTTATFAQRGNRSVAYSCCMNIPGLTEQQKTQITALEANHRKDMEAMRDARRKSGNYADRNAYQAAVDQKVADHTNAIRGILDADQKIIYDNIQAQNEKRNNQLSKMNKGSGQWGTMQGNGRGMGKR